MRGLGHDMIEISRVQRLIERYGQKFLDRLFTPEEQAYCLSKRAERVAGRFAAKEAVSKALGTGFREEVTWKGISILPGNDGQPVVTLSDDIMKRFDDPQISLSISHCKEYASAVAILV